MRDLLTSLRGLFSFPRRERPGILLLCLLLLITAALPLLFKKPPHTPPPQLVARADSFFRAVDTGGNKGGSYRSEDMSVHPSTSLSWFDPNALGHSDWARLGLPERTIRVILHYREKGGIFRRPEDLGRIWGLGPDLYARLRPHVRIASSQPSFRQNEPRPYALAYHRSDTMSHQNRGSFARKLEILDVNQADSLQWLALPGIGEKLTSRILRFRERLGGFCTVDQVGETWGLPDSTFQKIRPRLMLAVPVTRKIALNSAPEDILQQHPYIRFRLARTIIRYRQEHGPFTAVADLRRIALVTDDVYARLEPYCSVN